MSFLRPGETKSSKTDPLHHESSSLSTSNVSSIKNGSEKIISSFSSSPSSKVNLSKSVMGMKFMKRNLSPTTHNDNDRSSKHSRIDESIPSQSLQNHERNYSGILVPNISDHSIYINSIKVSCIQNQDRVIVNQYPGRRSFGGFNKAVERNYNEVLDEIRYRKLSQSKSSKYDINDEEMIERYKNLVGLPRGPNQNMKSSKKSRK